MATAGIITEYNPLHMGHVHLMREARRLLGTETGILCVMSGNYVQRGEFALVDKFARAAAAVQSGADLVLELPVSWALSSAEGFAAGAVEMMRATGAVTHLVFGSEGGDAAALVRVAEALCSGGFSPRLREELRKGQLSRRPPAGGGGAAVRRGRGGLGAAQRYPGRGVLQGPSGKRHPACGRSPKGGGP